MKKPQSVPFGTSQAVQPPDQIQERIRQRAHEIYEARGREHGHDMDDWLIAESEVTQNFQTIRKISVNN
jgi:Protein of unknown function (DUF2934)